MGFFKDVNEDAVVDEEVSSESIDELVSVTEEAEEGSDIAGTDEDLIDESLLENLFSEGDGQEDEVEIEEEYEIENEEEPAAEEVEEAPAYSATASEEQVTVITKGTTINGSIISDCSLNVMGTINGDIECIGKLSISGHVVGNSVASDVFVNTKRLDGNIDCDGTVKIGVGTVVVGDVKAGSAVIGGAVKGELDVEGPVIIDSTAIIKGNIKAKAVQMNNGAVLEGFCSLAYADVDIDDIFE